MADNPNGLVIYSDSPWFIEIVLFLLTIGLGISAWLDIAMEPRHNLAAILLSFFAIVCIVGMFAQGNHRTYTFDPANEKMTWTSKSLRNRSSGEVAFKDLGVTIDVTSDAESATSYRVMLTTPNGPMPLSRAYIGNLKAVEDEVLSLRRLIGQPTDSLDDDSVTQMARSGNKIGAVQLLRTRDPLSLTDAVRAVDDKLSD